MKNNVLTLSKPKSVGIWVRVSTEIQAQGDSPIHHEERAKEYAQNKRWQVEKIYRLEAVSGKTIIDHPECQRMLSDIKSGAISGLIISKFARLVRNTKELLEVSDIFNMYSADLISLDEPMDVSSTHGRLFLSIIGALAEWERKEIAGRVSASLPIRAKLGKSLGGAAPYGYKWEDKQLVVDKKEAPIRKLIYELYIKHKRKKPVADALNKLGYLTRNGSKWSDTTVHRLITDSSAKGLRKCNYTRSLGNKKHWIVKPEDDWVYSNIEPIISEKLWDEANKLINISLKKFTRKPTLTLFSGQIECLCGKKMYPRSSEKFGCGKCDTKIRISFVEKLFVETLNFLSSEEKVELLLFRATENFETQMKTKESLLREHSKNSSEMDKCYQLFVSGSIEIADFNKYYLPLKNKRQVLESQINEVETTLEALSKIKTTQSVIRNFQKIITWWNIGLLEEKIELAKNLIKQIHVTKDKFSIEFHSILTFWEKNEINLFVLTLISGIKTTIEIDGNIDIPYLKTKLDNYNNRVIRRIVVA